MVLIKKPVRYLTGFFMSATEERGNGERGNGVTAKQRWKKVTSDD